MRKPALRALPILALLCVNSAVWGVEKAAAPAVRAPSASVKPARTAVIKPAAAARPAAQIPATKPPAPAGVYAPVSNFGGGVANGPLNTCNPYHVNPPPPGCNQP